MALASAAAQAEIVAEPELAAFCTGEAAAELGTRPGNILTLPVERSGGRYIVYGQSPTDGADVTTFECTFGGDRSFIGLTITSRPSDTIMAGADAPPTAMAVCLEMIGVPAQVEVVSPLRPGFTEIILRETASGRRVACTASDAGMIEDWVELN
jgi:hypothetical protein